MTHQHAAPAREAALDILLRVEQSAAFSHLALSGALKRLDPKDRGLTTELVYGTLTYRLRLDRALSSFAALDRTPPAALQVMRLAAFQLLFLSRVPAHAILNDAVNQTKRVAGEHVARFVNAVLRKLSIQREPALPEGNSAEALSLRHSMPLWLTKRRLARMSPEALEPWLLAETQDAPLTLRVVDQAKADEVRQELSEKASLSVGALSPVALQIKELADPFSQPALKEGRCVVQDEGSQAVVLALSPPQGATVLDCCAGFGGKSLFLASLVGPTGKVVAVDLAEKKLNTLSKEAQRLGVSSIIQTQLMDLEKTQPELTGSFSYVLLDAPCSGLGTLRRHPELRWRRTQDDLLRCASLQKRLLSKVAHLVAKGGSLVYSVCSPEPEEGEEIIQSFLAKNPEFSIAAIEAPSLQAARTQEGFVKTFPHLHNADAFFIARLTRSTQE